MRAAFVLKLHYREVTSSPTLTKPINALSPSLIVYLSDRTRTLVNNQTGGRPAQIIILIPATWTWMRSPTTPPTSPRRYRVST